MSQINGNTAASLLPSTYFAPAAPEETGPVQSGLSPSSLSLSAEVLPLAGGSLTDGLGVPLNVTDTSVLLAEASFAFEKLIGDNAASRIKSQGADRSFASIGILARSGEVQVLQAELVTLTAARDEKQAELTDAKATLSSLATQRNDAAARLSTMDAMIDSTQLSIGLINQQLSVTTDPAARSILIANRDASVASLAGLQSTRNETLSTISTLDAQITSAQARVDALDEAVQTLTGQVAETGAALQSITLLLPLLAVLLMALPNVTDGVLGRGQDQVQRNQVQSVLEEAGTRSIDIDRALAELDLEKDIALDLIDKGDVARRLITAALSLAEGMALLARTFGELLAKTPPQPELPFERGNRLSLAV